MHAAIPFVMALVMTTATEAAVNGNQYVAVNPVFTGADGNLSFIRLLNVSSGTTQTFTVVVVGTPSGTEYGRTTYQVPPRASPQHALNAILTQANAGPLSGGDTGYSLYLQNSNVQSAFQHVIFNDNNRFFENMSSCQYIAGMRYVETIGWLPNVHTTRLAAFPMRIYVHNFTVGPRPFRVNAYDAVTGTKIGETTVTVAGNETLTIQESALEQTLNFTPTASQLHLNIFVELADGGTFNGIATVASTVFNSALAAQINMSTHCKLR
jgi:hypothetical protein